MLVLSRRVDESILIGDAITVTIVGIDGGQVRLGIDAPNEVEILRDNAKKREPRDRSPRGFAPPLHDWPEAESGAAD